MLLPLHLIPPGLCPGEKSQKLGFQFSRFTIQSLNSIRGLAAGTISLVCGAQECGETRDKDVRSDLGPVLRWSCPTLLGPGGCIYHQLTFDLVYIYSWRH